MDPMPAIRRRPSRQPPPAVAMVSLGCAKNTVDTEIILGELLEGGFALATDPGLADLVVVNTCGFIQAARD